VPDEIAAAVLSVRHRHKTWGPRKVRAWLVARQPGVCWPASSTIGVLFDRAGLTVPRRLRRRVPPRTAPLAHCTSPNEVWTVDFKGWFKTGDGARCDPLTLQDADSRYFLRCRGLERLDCAHVWPQLEVAFRAYGLPDALRSDNGAPFASQAIGGLSRLGVKLIKAGVRPERIAPGKPQQNGRHERLHLTLKQETARPPAASLRAQQRRFDRFQRIYNEERPHEALGDKTPASVYRPSPRAYRGRLQAPHYPDGHQVRRVRSNGDIKWRGRTIFISGVLAGEPLGLEERNNGQWAVAFGPLELGILDHKGRFHKPRLWT
jgi:transposase InsO family protein